MRRLTGTVQPYAWGSPTRIPELIGRPADGTPQAELWLGAHPTAPSQLGGPGEETTPLPDAILDDPESTLGPASVAAFGTRLPYLMKVLAADQPLSLQAHPTRAQAEDGFARERRAGIAAAAPDRVFSDDWPKPELFCALSESEALCGFRVAAETHTLFEQLGVAAAAELVAPLAQGDDRALAAVFARLLRLPESERAVVDDVVAAAASVNGSDPGLGRFARTAIELNRFYPGDPGILAALLMNRMTLAPGEAIYLPAGNLHAYLSGFGVEIMANSDNVLRGGLTKKFVAADELLDILDFTAGPVSLVEVVEESSGVFCYRTPAPEFRLWRIEIDAVSRPVPATPYGRVLLATAGRVAVLGPAGEDLVLVQGESLFAEAGEDLRVGGSGTLFVGAPGLD